MLSRRASIGRGWIMAEDDEMLPLTRKSRSCLKIRANREHRSLRGQDLAIPLSLLESGDCAARVTRLLTCGAERATKGDHELVLSQYGTREPARDMSQSISAREESDCEWFNRPRFMRTFRRKQAST